MANVTIWDGSATFTSVSPSPFGFYESDTEFQTVVIKVAKFCGTWFGYHSLDIELK